MGKETAEQRLLRLIEEADGKDGGAPVAPVKGASEAQRVFQSVSTVGAVEVPPVLKGILEIFVRRPSAPGAKMEFGLRQVNQALLAVTVGMAALFVLDFTGGIKVAQRPVSFIVHPKGLDAGENFLPDIRDLAEYVSVVTRRNIFLPVDKKAVEAAIAEPVDNQRIREKTADLKLVGISWLNSPESATVMLEDQKTSITHFLRTGDSLGGVRVETIYADRAVLSFEGEILTINL